MKISRRTLLPMVVTLIAVVGLTACGSDDDASTNSDSSSTSTGPAAPSADIKTATDPELGTILVDSEGRTVYTFTKDGAAVECTGTCLAVWPAVLLPEGTESATGAEGVTGLGVTSVGDGEQVTVNDLPLYRFTGDEAAGDVNGNDVEGFGGLWRVVAVDSGGTGAASSSTTTTTAPDDGYDDGY